MLGIHLRSKSVFGLIDPILNIEKKNTVGFAVWLASLLFFL